MTEQERIESALQIAKLYGQTDGAHHKMWVIDQMVRAMTADNYPAWVAAHNNGKLGPDTYEWDTGMAP